MLHIDAHHAPSSVFPCVPRHKSGGTEAAGQAAAVDDEALAGDILRRIGRQKHTQGPSSHHSPRRRTGII